MPEPRETEPTLLSGLTPKRLEALTDGIFAIAMTLLVLNLRVPQLADSVAGSRLPGELADMWRHFLTYVLSFYLLAVFWVVHHRQFRHMKKVDEPLLWINILGLMLVALIPFSTSLESEYGNHQIAAVFFEMNLLLAGAVFTWQFWYASRKHRLVDPDLSQEVIGRSLRRGLVMPVTSAIAIAVSFVFPAHSTMVYLATPLVLRSRWLRRAGP